ncbi:hypothetical protein GLOTRDRAFT_104964 [Gloeophyllum trabeum ATCC 11539]|uniref:RhoGEF-domain-containing protein n=1 Tax=Gloeophyllum trabeum (strain ATCC 11539 / FP-39264 / Madison 617) TaxID=670483 RepID=S7QDN4_GLOTA|nr:uncharacterized protein GLOTRDRAFT_104964 [Gloeophyllum trabeum ATCC 11539]EPQ57442.1 hypothetical protein GLOTRDRAFT_104964 [Gloeophyllum trabeum ATCC 11539]
MSTVAGRKKSIVSNAGFQIETPVAHNTLLNKAASSSTSLYQQCSALRARLMRLPAFPDYFALSSPPDSSRQSTDPVTQLWDCFALGFPLCYIFNLLPPPISPIAVDTDPSSVDVNNERTKKRAIALFAMQIRQVPECEQFTVTDLWERHSNDGFVKAVKTVTTLVDRLPEEVFLEAPPSSPPSVFPSHESSESLVTSDPTHFSTPANAQEAARMNIIREMVETERKYVQDLEVMQNYSNSLSQSNTIDQDTIHLLFPNLNKLLNFQRKFLIRFEGTAEMSWKDQHWGVHFIECEEEFAVYEPYCANYNTAQDIMLAEEQNLMSHNHLINVKSELPAFLIKPVQRICKYPLLLESLIKASPASEYPHLEELKQGCAAAKRITDRINEAQRRAENKQTVKNLESRVEDWKGHHLSNFGDLLLDDIFVVTKSDVDREYHVFLFEKIILCCKEASQSQINGKKVNKSNSLLKKQPNGSTTPLPGGVGPPKKKNTPLLLKGRIFLNNVTQAAPNTKSGYSLAVWWKGEDDLEHFTLRCRTDEQLKQWEAAINRLINEVAARRVSERNTSKFLSQMTNSTSPAPQSRPPHMSYAHEKTYSTTSQTSYGTLPPYPGPMNGRVNRQSSPYSSEEQINGGYVNVHGGGPYGYPGHEGFDVDPDDEYEDYPPAVSRPPSGRGTPVNGRRSNVPSSVDRDGYDVNATMSRMASPSLPHPPPMPGLPQGPMANRPPTTRLSSTASVASHASDASFGTGVKPKLRSQFSSSKLKAAYDAPNGAGALPPNGLPSMRTRSASQPTAYVPKQVPPPLPTSTPWTDQSRAQNGFSKRGSGSSQSTGDSSDYSPQTTSPITPYGSSDSSLGGALRPSRSQNFDHLANGKTPGPQVKVKVHFHEDIFVIQVPKSTEYVELVERVGRKIRLCGPRRDDGPLRVKYKDEDGDMVSLGSTEDVQMAFESYRPGGQVTLYVT